MPARTSGTSWWKTWVLVTSVGGTLLGWVAGTSPEPANNVQVSAPAAGDPAIRSTPGKRVFRAPVTRTRRS